MAAEQVLPVRVRAVARVGGAAPIVRGAPVFVAHRRPGRIGGVSVVRLVLVQLALAGAALGLGRFAVLQLAAVVLALLVLVATFARWHGRWWSETVVLRWQHRQRRITAPAPSNDPRLVALRSLVPDLTVQTVELSGGERIGVGRDGSGWFAVAALAPPEGVSGDARPAPPLDALARLLVEFQQPGAVAQVVTHTVPALAGAVAGQPYADSYLELVRAAGHAPPGEQLTWVAVRLNLRAVAPAVARGEQPEEEIPALVAVLLRRTVKRLRRAGLRTGALDADGVLEALARSCDLDRGAGRGSTHGRESWTSWQSEELAHACFWVRSWPKLSEASGLLTALSAAPAALTSVAMLLEPAGDGVDLRCLTRIASPAAALPAACRSLHAAAERTGGHLFQLDGEQAPAVYASAPTGGGTR
jgi:type VII secretion protein EccE